MLTLCVAVLCLIGQGASALHFALVEHVRCAEHAAVEHRASDEYGGGHEHAIASVHEHAVAHAQSRQVDPASEQLRPGGDDHSHQDCDALITSTRPALGEHEWVSVGADAAAGGSLSAALAHFQHCVWMLAPKTSPPA